MAAVTAYKYQFGIEEMFKDCKTGGYNLEGSKASEKRLSSIILALLGNGCKLYQALLIYQ